MPSSRIFVSYTHAGDERGSEIARQLINDLQANKAEVVTDSETVSDENFLAFLNRELPQCQYLIFVQTPVALKSLRVQTAVNMALTMAAQQRIRNILRLIAVASDGPDPQPQWSAARTFDASTDYPRARDKLFLELDLIELDENMSLIMPPFPDSPPAGPPPGNSMPPMSLSSGSGSVPLASIPPAGPANSFNQQLSGPVPKITAPGSVIPALPQAPGFQRTPPTAWQLPQPGIQPPGTAAIFQPGNQPFSRPPINREPNPPGAYSSAAPAFRPSPGSGYSALPGDDLPPSLSKKRRFTVPTFFSRPIKTLQTRIAAQPGKLSIEELETIREDRPLPLKSPRQTFIRRAVVIALILILILGTTLTIIQIRNHSTAKKPPTPILSHGTPITQPTSLANTATVTTQKVGTIDPLSTADSYTNDKTLALNDNLASEDTQSQWHTTPSGPTSCSFTNGAYDMTSTGSHYCLADNTNFSDFDYQIQMRIVKGTTAGILFRANNTRNTFYYFEITTSGQFFLWRSDGSKTALVRVPNTSTFAGAISQGLNEANIIAVSAIGGQLKIYVNGTNMVNVTEGTYTSGNIGVMVGAANSTTGTTEATYQYAKVWTP